MSNLPDIRSINAHSIVFLFQFRHITDVATAGLFSISALGAAGLAKSITRNVVSSKAGIVWTKTSLAEQCARA